MISLEADGMDAIARTMGAMADSIAQLGSQKMAPELTTWQTEDMKRRFPNTKQEDEKTVSTEIWPRSRISEKRKPKLFSKPPRQVYAKPVATGIHRVLHSTRPVLREELFESLCERMAKLMSENLQWQTRA